MKPVLRTAVSNGPLISWFRMNATSVTAAPVVGKLIGVGKQVESSHSSYTSGLRIEVVHLLSIRNSNRGDFFPSVLALVDRVAWYLLPVGSDRYPQELVEGCGGAA